MSLRLPPHIEERQGLYFSTLSNRYIRKEKIELICELYWQNNELERVQEQEKVVKQEIKTIKKKLVRMRKHRVEEKKPVIRKSLPPVEKVFYNPLFSARINELIACGKVKVMTFEEYKAWKSTK